MEPFARIYASPVEQTPTVLPYTYDDVLQLNVLPDRRAAIQDRALLVALGATTSTAGSATHFDD
ncbi:putative ATP-grasp-modified RiPP [Streptomyces sp. NPDC048527]|uniref:putative ATP-grasp-modified RiPP n=1 Tax=Streptomyces sp. NPDC048527 TaxID=3365568 RepID=UPI00371D357E